jgi:hypothetical protein
MPVTIARSEQDSGPEVALTLHLVECEPDAHMTFWHLFLLTHDPVFPSSQTQDQSITYR